MELLPSRARSIRFLTGLAMTDAAPPRPTRFRTGGLGQRKPTRFAYAPDAATRDALAGELGLLSLPALRLTGEITPSRGDEMVLTARLEAKAIQACVVTLAPVPAHVDEDLRRRYVPDLAVPEADEIEMPADDTVETLPEVIDLAEIAAEALMLALPLYPRAPGAEFAPVTQAAEGVQPLADEVRKPFADLAGRLAAKSGSTGDGKD
jgi:uncharacterized metal-binding protein YceD (DUF177 family)